MVKEKKREWESSPNGALSKKKKLRSERCVFNSWTRKSRALMHLIKFDLQVGRRGGYKGVRVSNCVVGESFIQQMTFDFQPENSKGMGFEMM